MARKRFTDLENHELQAAFAKIYKSGFSYAQETFESWTEGYKTANDHKGVQTMKELDEKLTKLLNNPPKIEELY